MSNIVLRRSKNSPLTHDEMDDNLSSLNDTKIEKSDFNNVDNTSDDNKPVSTAQQTALALKANAANPTTSGTLTHIGNAGIGTETPRAAHHVHGAGQTTANLTDAGPRGDMLRVSGIGTPAGTGGVIAFANSQGDNANSVGFAAIKGLLSDGGTNTSGHIAFSTRNSASDTSLTERLRIEAGGNVLVTSASGIGYGPGAGGTVTQPTSKSTNVTLNKPTGRVTMHAAALAPGASVEFIISNTAFGVNDGVILTGRAWSGRYRIENANSATGQIGVRVTNVNEGTLTDPIDIDFQIIKGATS